MPPPLSHRCATCGKAYSTNSHLRRHEATHSGRQELTCPLCHAQFTRRDLARRHVQNCSTHGHEVTLPTLKRGRKRVSCDSCSQRKIACDAKKPCTRCSIHGATCTYERMSTASSSATYRVKTDTRPTRTRTDDDVEVSARRTGPRISIDFLLNFTNPSGYRPAATISAEAPDVDVVDHDVDSQLPSIHSEENLDFYDQPLDITDDFYYFPLFMSSEENGELSPGVINYFPMSDPELMSAFETRAGEMVSQLCAQQLPLQDQYDGGEARPGPSVANALFTAANVRHFVWAFFHYFHSSFPLIHRATFDVRTVSLPLLLVVVLFGSMSCNPSDISLSMRQFFAVAESHIFNKILSTSMPLCSEEAFADTCELELLQAGVLLMILQNNSNDLQTRRRIRLHRIPSLITAVRASGLLGYKRRHPITNANCPEWRIFISDEARVRLALWTFMTDSTLAVFFNSPPQVALSEMTGDLPCEEELFNADTALGFKRAALMHCLRPPTATLSNLTSSLLSPGIPISLAHPEEHLTATDMLMLICALLAVITTSRMNFLDLASVEAISLALGRWKDLWDVVSKDQEGKSKSFEGFEKHAVEYWWLARTIVKIGHLRDQSCRYMNPVPTDSAEDLHDFVRKYKDIL